MPSSSHMPQNSGRYLSRMQRGISDYNDVPRTFDVLSFHAKGDGVSDDTKAFEAAWQQACQVDSSILSVPSGYTFLLGPITFSGPCRPGITFQVDGTIVAPNDLSAWGASNNLLQWLNFKKLNDMVLQGTPSKGLIDGRGALWWAPKTGSRKLSTSEFGRRLSSSSTRPTAVRFYGSTNVTVQDITIVDSPQTHLKFDSCWNVLVSHVYISSPASSPNTDGIHLQNTQNTAIRSSYLRTGDDCVSIQTGCANVIISDLICGPGHGISIGGLGEGGSKACVSNISVTDTFIHNSLNGVRIKTWQGGSGSVKKISFSNISVSNVSNAIIIDQFYCNSKSCQNKTSAVSITDVSYRSIRGTYFATSAIHFACSDTIPCTEIVLDDIELLTFSPRQTVNPVFCWNSFGQIYSGSIPKIFCLQSGEPRRNRVETGSETC
ncbi:hypothetical protein O6H91_04G007500 [Diphasiastrum complanatum]|nr:hypothetical protein O6H91_04G007500 [Diphasiastrum complanatum]